MEREVLAPLAHLLESMKEAADKLDDAIKKEDVEKVASIKREILEFQKQVSKLL